MTSHLLLTINHVYSDAATTRPSVGGWESTAGEDAPIEPHGPNDGDS